MSGSVASSSRVLIVTTDRIAASMAGPAIRAWELARLLVAEGHDVVVASPHPVERQAVGVRSAVASDRESLEPLAASADVVVGIAGCIHHHPWLADLDHLTIVADAYDPTALEALERHRPVEGQPGDGQSVAGAGPGAGFDAQDEVWASYADGLAQMVEPLRWADLVLCASERQRDLLTGILLAVGRVNPTTYAADPTLSQLLAIVPFGLPDEPAVRPEVSPLRGPEGSGRPARPDDLVLLWGGGVYDWLDPLTLVEAVARVPEIDGRRVVAVFPGTVHPTPEVAPMAMVERVRELAGSHGLLGERVFLGDRWVPYHERAGWLLDADVGVSLHGRHLETIYAFRTRMLDYLWTALPILCTDGDSLADLVRAEGLGRVVPPGDPDAVVEALRSMTAADQIPTQRRALEQAADRHTWPVVAAPLLAHCADPRRAADRVGSAPAAVPAWLDVVARRAAADAQVPSAAKRSTSQRVHGLAGRALRPIRSAVGNRPPDRKAE